MKVKYRCKINYDLNSPCSRYLSIKVEYKLNTQYKYTQLDKSIFYISDRLLEMSKSNLMSFTDHIENLHNQLSTEEGRNDMFDKIKENIIKEIKIKYTNELDEKELNKKIKNIKKNINNKNSIFKGEFEI